MRLPSPGYPADKNRHDNIKTKEKQIDQTSASSHNESRP